MKAKKLLHRVRFAVVASFYSKKGLILSEKNTSTTDIFKETRPVTETVTSANKQVTLHPSLKKLIGKSPIDYEELLRFKPTPMRQAARTAKSTITEKLTRKKKDHKTTHTITAENNEETSSNLLNTEQAKVPRYIPPIQKATTIPSLNSSRHRNQTRHLIIVGNTSKYIGDEKSKDGVTHKWLVYLKTKTDIPIENFVKKVRFFLHSSYKPNDVIEVLNPPFQLSRRGWGEFPIRLQLYFDASTQQKPLQIYHNLILDRKMTGLQTMGAETVVELWLSRDSQISATLARDLRFKSEMIHNDLQPIKTPTTSTITNGDLNLLNSGIEDDYDSRIGELFGIKTLKMEPDLQLIDKDFFEDVDEETCIDSIIDDNFNCDLLPQVTIPKKVSLFFFFTLYIYVLF